MKKILIVDDEPEILALIVIMLREYSTLCSGGVASALAELKKDSYHLVLTDNRMPDGTGIELASEIKILGYDLPVLVMSGEPAPSPDELRLSGIAGWINKPFRKDDLKRQVAEALGKCV